MNTKTCLTCRFWKPVSSADAIGKCDAPLPIAIAGLFVHRKKTRGDTTGCPAWHKRIVRNPRVSASLGDFSA